MENKNFNWRPMSEYTGGRVLATNGLDVLIGEINSEGDCESEEDSGTILCGITGFIKIEEMLPELKESEDEKVCKEIKQFIRSRGMQLAQSKVESWIAWLEKQCEKPDANKEYWRGYREGKKEVLDKYTELKKQGEQKPADKVEPKFSGGDWVVTDKNNIVQIKAIENGKYVLENTMRFSVDYVDKCWRKWDISDANDGDVLTQKPAWSEEDEEMLDGIIVDVEVLKEQDRTKDGKAAYQKEIDWLKNLKDRVQPQPKREWSEEKEKDLFNAAKHLREYAERCVQGEYSKIEIFSLADRIESFRPQNTWKPNLLSDIISGCNKGEFSQFEYSLIHFAMACSDENMTPKGIHCYAQTSLNEAKKEIKLTEEDEKTVHLACKFIRHHSNPIDSIGGIDCSTLIERLKSLRPQNGWKPSDEQIRVLNEVINHAAESKKPHWNDYIFGTLNNLIRQLKKLRGE